MATTRISTLCRRWAEAARGAAPARAASTVGAAPAAPREATGAGILAMEFYAPKRFVAQSKLETADGVSAGK
jgi:hypothetical protein